MKNKTDLSNYTTGDFKIGKNIFVQTLWYFSNILFFINPFNPFSSVKIALLKAFGASIGKNVNIKPSVNIKYPWKLKLGNNVWIGEKVWIDNLSMVEIGDNSVISQGALILCGNHDYKSINFSLITKAITIEDGVWIGAKSIVCNGARCSAHSVLSVNSVASSNLKEYGIYKGNPAQLIKFREIN